MRTIQLTRLATNPTVALTVPCQPGELVRVVAYSVALSTPGGGEQLQITFQQSTKLLFDIGVTPLVGTEREVAGAIGLNPVPLQQSLVDPATGVISYTNLRWQNVPLPDIWFDREVTVSIAADVGFTTIGEIVLTYQVQPADKSR